MATTPPSRRERLRVATVSEIKESARRLLVAGGPSAISLRAIGRGMGMTAPAIYRYFPSLDALVAAVCADLYDELSEVLEAAGGGAGPAASDGAGRADDDAQPAASDSAGRAGGGAGPAGEGADPAGRLAGMSRAFRRWAIDHPAEFALMFGNPVAGADAFEEDSALYGAGARFGAAFLGPFAELWRRNPIAVPPAAALGPHLQPYFTMYGDDLPVDAVYLLISAWARLYGVVALEVFGHFQWALTDAEPFFETELALFLNQLAGLDSSALTG
jgi:AcrR family transcriptional regulator